MYSEAKGARLVLTGLVNASDLNDVVVRESETDDEVCACWNLEAGRRRVTLHVVGAFTITCTIRWYISLWFGFWCHLARL